MSGLARMASIPELRRRILFTLLMLCVYWMGVQIPTPEINSETLADFFQQYSSTLFGMFNIIISFMARQEKIIPFTVIWKQCN